MIDVQQRINTRDPGYEQLDYCINMVAAGKLYQMQSEVMLEGDSDSCSEDSSEKESEAKDTASK
jgi:hypothetical protein